MKECEKSSESNDSGDSDSPDDNEEEIPLVLSVIEDESNTQTAAAFKEFPILRRSAQNCTTYKTRHFFDDSN